MQLDRILPIVAGSLLATSIAFAHNNAAPPQTAAVASPTSKSFTASINGDSVYLRSGPSKTSSYPFGRLMTGDVVDVQEESFGWAKIYTRGPAFSNIFGYVLANDKVTLSADGKMLTVVSATEVRAPNIGADGNPDASFKAVGQLAAGTMIPVVGKVDGEREKVFKVTIPPNAIGYVDMSFIRRASRGEAAATASVATTPATINNAAAEVAAIEGGTTIVAESSTPPAVGATTNVNVVSNPPAIINLNDGKNQPDSAVNPVVTVKTAIPVAKKMTPPSPAPNVKTEAEIAGEKRRAAHTDLEAIWVKVKAEPLGSSELVTLKERYVILVNDPLCESDIKGLSGTRIKQLEIQIEAQERIQQLKSLRAGVDADTDQLKAIKRAMEARSDYTVVGVLNASTVYDGVWVPLLFRLTDPAAGQTVAYITAKDPTVMTTMLGTLIGIRGTQRFDEALKVNIVDPGSIDILTIRRDAMTQPSDASTGGDAKQSN